MIDIDLINVYISEPSQLSLEEAMKVATQRDQEAAAAFEGSVLDAGNDEVPQDVKPEETIIRHFKTDYEIYIEDLYGRY